MFRFMLRSFVVMSALAVCVGVLASEAKQEDKAEAFKKKIEQIMSGKGEGGKFIGSNSCRMCHLLPKVGAQFRKWQSGPHSKAYKALTTEEGKKRAAAKNIDTPQEDKNCLQCHAPIATVPEEFVAKTYKPDEGVGCEACHGPGEKHADLQKTAMREKKDIPEATEVLLKVPDPENKKVLCGECHREHEWHEMEKRNHLEAWKEISHMKPEE